MLRRIRAKLHPPIYRPPFASPFYRLSSSAALARYREHEEDEHHEPYGVEYGAGPSRIPYQPPYIPNHHSHLSPTPISHLNTTRALRRNLDALAPGSYAQPQVFLRTLFNQSELWTIAKDVTYHEDLASISRLEFHILLHHLIRKKKGNLAAAVISDVLGSTSRNKRRKLLSSKTLTILCKDRSLFSMFKANSRNRSPPNTAPTLEDQKTLEPSRDLSTLLNIIDTLQEVRYQRPIELYQLIIKQCVDERLYDLAAKVYVGLVEEWVTEGRVAHGADPDDFHPGGGPPRDSNGKRESLSTLLGHWWTGVRTWRLPGEVLSPHDRLDLWHPKHLSLGEKMKNFPLPLATSPPSLTPQPKTILLNTIIHSLQLDPKACSPNEFASSMRALAILANTVLSRTLPIVSLGRLLQAFKSAPSRPSVYPENITEIPSDNEWAYTSFTQIHVTLMSLLFSPPISSHSMQLIAENQDLNAEEEPVAQVSPPEANQYMTPPLSWKSCTILLQYAIQSLRRPFRAKRLLQYMKEVFNMGGGQSENFDTLLKGGSALQLNAIAAEADVTIFGIQKYDRPSHAPDQRLDSRFFSSSQRVNRQQPFVLKEEENALVDVMKSAFENGQSPLPTEQSLLLLIKHLTVTSQFNRLENLVYILEPYLEFSTRMPEGLASHRIASKGLDAGISGRPRSHPLSHHVYLSLLRGLRKAGTTGLAQRVFNLALYSERGQINQFFKENPKGIIPESMKFPLEGYQLMIDVWGNETRFIRRSLRQRDNIDKDKVTPKGWLIPAEYRNLPRGVAAGYMTMVTHHLAKRSFPPEEFNQDYYNSLIRACRFRWKLSEDKQVHHEFLPEIKQVCLDTEKANLEVPEILVAKLRHLKTGARFRWRQAGGKNAYKRTVSEEEKLLDKLLDGESPDILHKDKVCLFEDQDGRKGDEMRV